MADTKDRNYNPSLFSVLHKSQTTSGKRPSIIFPFHLCNISNWRLSLNKRKKTSFVRSWLASNFSVHAAEPTIPTTQVESGIGLSETQNQETDSHYTFQYSPELEALARAYIEKETGMERVKQIFQKDHTGRESIEMEYMQVALVQTFIISFFIKYVPEFRNARKDFIREHHATVFRTRTEAVRRMQDHISLRAGLEGGKFAAKMTAFGASFVFLSQMISSYRNKTSVLDYATAAGITGGLARVQLGVKGFLSGSIVGGFLGSIIGGIACMIFKAHNLTQEERHLFGTMSLLEVQKSVEGEDEMRRKLDQIYAEKREALSAS